MSSLPFRVLIIVEFSGGNIYIYFDGTDLHVMKYIMSLLLAVFLLSCDTQYKTGRFEGIIATGIDGVVMGEFGEDDGDWGLNDSFSSKESDLFNGVFENTNSADSYAIFTVDTVGGYTSTMVMAYPNPTSDTIRIAFLNSEDYGGIFKLVIVDSDYDVKIRYAGSFDGNGFLNIVLALGNLEIIYDDLHRIYYLSEDITGTVHIRGHGDFIYTSDVEGFFSNK